MDEMTEGEKSEAIRPNLFGVRLFVFIEIYVQATGIGMHGNEYWTHNFLRSLPIFPFVLAHTEPSVFPQRKKK